MLKSNFESIQCESYPHAVRTQILSPLRSFCNYLKQYNSTSPCYNTVLFITTKIVFSAPVYYTCYFLCGILLLRSSVPKMYHLAIVCVCRIRESLGIDYVWLEVGTMALDIAENIFSLWSNPMLDNDKSHPGPKIDAIRRRTTFHTV